ncbi:MAG: hypothetical protein ACP5H7_02705 [Minisyncoccia bacterium]
MKVLIFGDNFNSIVNVIKKHKLTIVQKNPDVVISYGGDGTLIRSEFLFPGIPKLILKNSQICKVCYSLSNDKVLQLLAQKKYKIQKIWKLETQLKNKKIFALNDIVIHNKDPRHGIRYKVFINGNDLNKEIIGDGVVIATPFGSTAYYKSITGSFFEIGIGVAFNNSTEESNHMVLDEGKKIKVTITRGPAIIYADNQPDIFDLNKGDEVLIKKSKNFAKIIYF